MLAPSQAFTGLEIKAQSVPDNVLLAQCELSRLSWPSVCHQAGTNYLLINGQLVDVASLDFFKVLWRNPTPSAECQQMPAVFICWFIRESPQESTRHRCIIAHTALQVSAPQHSHGSAFHGKAVQNRSSHVVSMCSAAEAALMLLT